MAHTPIHRLGYRTRSTRVPWRWRHECREWAEALLVLLGFLLAGTAVFFVVASAFLGKLVSSGMGP